MSRQFMLKILTSGEGGVGKTTLLHRYVEGNFAGNMRMSIGVEFFAKDVVMNDKHCSLQLWDFGGQERFRFFLKDHVQGAKGALLMFDLTRPVTLETVEEWCSLVRSANSSLPIILVGTKLDLTDRIQVKDEHALEVLEQFDLFDYIKTSSKTGEKVDMCFDLLVHKIIERFS